MKTKFLSASKFKVSVDSKQLLKELTVENGSAFGNALQQYLEPQIEQAQKELVDSFVNHPVTKEIDSGVNASNSSGTLGGYGNLFTFIGFESSDNPTQIVKDLLSKKWQTRVIRKSANGRYELTIFAPDKKELYAATPMPWLMGKSWLQGIEQGISGLGRYIYSDSGFKNSRSGQGIQSSDNRTSGVRFRRVSYMSQLYENFSRRLTKIK